MARLNDPTLWKNFMPVPSADSHKYRRGVALLFGAPSMTGATRLAAEACARMGAGMVVVAAADAQSAMIYRSTLPPHIVVEDAVSVQAHLADPRRTAILGGPGGGAGRGQVLDILSTRRPAVLDASALTCFSQSPDEFFSALHPSCILTPHEGEFTSLFPDLAGEKGAVRVEKAASQAGCTILLKGHESVIASPGRETLYHDLPAPYLATAGSGDVLAGMMTGLLAQGMPVYESCAAAVFLHRMMGRSFGAGLVAADLPDLIPFVLRDLWDHGGEAGGLGGP